MSVDLTAVSASNDSAVAFYREAESDFRGCGCGMYPVQKSLSCLHCRHQTGESVQAFTIRMMVALLALYLAARADLLIPLSKSALTCWRCSTVNLAGLPP